MLWLISLQLAVSIAGHFKHSTIANHKLDEIQERLGIKKHTLQQDEPALWNYTLYMLKTVYEPKFPKWTLKLKAWQIATPVCDPSILCVWRTAEVRSNSLPIQWAVILISDSFLRLVLQMSVTQKIYMSEPYIRNNW